MDPFFIRNLGSVAEASTGEHWDSTRLQREIYVRAGYFLHCGVERGVPTVIMHGNNVRFFADLFAMWMIGAPVACLDTGVGVDEFSKLVAELGATAVVVNGDVPGKLSGMGDQLRFIDTQKADHWMTAVEASQISPIAPDDTALILYTSGSTGLPKGVVHTPRTLQTKWLTLRQYMPLSIVERTLCVLPVHFGHGLICNALYPLVHGKTVVVLPKADMAALIKLPQIIDNYKISFMSSVPSIWKLVLRLCDSPQKGSLVQINIGSAPLASELWKQVQAWAGTSRVWNTYGITETGSWIGGALESYAEVEPEDGLIGHGWGSDIFISEATHISAVTSNSHEVPTCAIGQKGYVWLRTPAVMKEYFKRPDQTSKVLQGGCFYTGDLGYIDDRGRLFLTGRVRTEINKGGIKISPEELDLVIEGHDAISEACAFTIEDPVLGENIGICIVFNAGVKCPSVYELTRWCEGVMSEYKIPMRWYQVDSIPKTSRGKIKRSDVAQNCETREALN